MSDFDSHDIQEAHQALVESQNTKEAVPFNPIGEVENSLVNLLKYRIKKVETEDAYEDMLKQTLQARLPEATISELLEAIRLQQTSTKSELDKILVPFLPKMAPMLEDKAKNSEETLFKTLQKEDIQALDELRKALTILGNNQPSESSDIKSKLGLTSDPDDK